MKDCFPINKPDNNPNRIPKQAGGYGTYVKELDKGKGLNTTEKS